MTPTDLQLLSRYHLHGDAEAFRSLVEANAGMVFATANRITCNAVRAEDVAQETFFQLAHQSKNLTQSVAAWLHRVAWRRACNAIRDDAARRRAERGAAALHESEGTPSEKEASWADVEKVLDETIDELPDKLREPLVMHFLQGRSQREIAAQFGVNQSTISRLIAEGIIQLRSCLKNRGVICGTGLALLLSSHSATAAPATLLASLGKLSMSGIGAASTSASVATSWLKPANAVLATVVSIVVIKGKVAPTSLTDVVESAGMKRVPHLAVPNPLILEKLPGAEPEAASPRAPAKKPTPRHELIHSFPMPPRGPNGNLVLDEHGWLWGTTSRGGHYGVGTLYRMKLDGSEWEEMVAFNGHTGVPKGGAPNDGVVRTPDGRLWGTTGDPGTIFCFDPRTGRLNTEIEFEKGEVATGLPIVLPEGQICFSTYKGIFRYDPESKKRSIIKPKSDPEVSRSPVSNLSEMVSDGRGSLWATTSNRQGNGHVVKVNPSTGEMVRILSFTGQSGSHPGKNPVCGLTLGSDGFLWGCTREGGKKDQGTVFKIHPETSSFFSVKHLQWADGMNPESKLVDDGQGFMWGTATYGAKGGGYGRGTIYKIELNTGTYTVVTRFTGFEGASPGGNPRGHLLRMGPNHLVGVTNFWGAASSGVIYRVNTLTGQYTVLKDLADLAVTTEGGEPHGSLVETADGTLWGTTHYHGAHHCGTIYRLDPASKLLLSVVDFTGVGGPFPGRSPDAGLISDGQGWLWGTTRFGGQKDQGTIFKLHETSGEFRSIAEFGIKEKPLAGGGPMTEMAQDERGQLWGTANDTVFRVNPTTNTVESVVTFRGDKREPFGSELLGKLVPDGRGYVWGCALADRTNQKASLYRIRTEDAVFETVEVFPSATQDWPGWHPPANMFRDGSGSIWFTGVLENGGPVPKCTLNRLDPQTGRVVDRHLSRSFSIIDTPIDDGHGRLWGSVGNQSNALYTFDLASGEFQRALEFTGQGSQHRSGSQPMFGRPMRASDGNLYSVTRYGGPGNGGTIYRLRFGPTPITKEAVILADGRVELHGVMQPNGQDTDVSFEWSTDPTLKTAHTLQTGVVKAGEEVKSVRAILSGLKQGTPHYFRICGRNADNPMPQRGSILQFTVPTAETSDSVVATLSSQSAPDSATTSQGDGTEIAKRYGLKIIMVPGAGAGIVLGRLRGQSYEIGKSYTLTAKADNRYVFAHWSGPGISGTPAENPQLKFTFTEELAKQPVITATFDHNPFHERLLGPYHGLVRALEEVTPSIESTGAIKIQLTEFGDFTGTLHYDGEEWPLTGVFDTGGSGRFGEDLAFNAAIPRSEKPTLLLNLHLDLSEGGIGVISGQIGQWNEGTALWQSQISAAHCEFVTNLAENPVVQHLHEMGSLNVDLQVMDVSDAVSPGRVTLSTDGRLQFSVNLPDGVAVLDELHLSRQLQLSFFHPYADGSLGLEVPLADLLMGPRDDEPQHNWWISPGAAPRPIRLRATQSDAGAVRDPP